MEEKYLTVTQLNKYIKYKFDTDVNLKTVFLRGEISNFKNHTTGHLYFTLKDENSRILAVMFRNSAVKINFKPNDGDKVLVVGRVSSYEANGAYQIYVDEMILDGVGNLYLEFEKLKKKLSELGYFDVEVKKPIPKFPKRIGVITASTGAAIRDIITTINRRYHQAEIILFPCLVQGDSAATDIVRNLDIADSYNLDVIILGRGGGSIEDLWPFNEEIVAHAMYKTKTPIISAVGHEIDFTIADFVADLRAPTPTAGAELAVPNTQDLLNYIKQLEIRSSKGINNKIDMCKTKLNALTSSYILKNPSNIYEIKMQKLDNLIEKLESNIKLQVKNKEHRFINMLNKLEALNPILTIKRGYSVSRIEDMVVTSIKSINKDDILITELSDGKISSKVVEVEAK